MRISDQGVELVKHFEGLRLAAYQDSAGYWTVGYGHTGRGVQATTRVTEEQAEQLLRHDLKLAEAGVIDLTAGLALTQGQFDALVSFVFNLGASRLRASTLLRKLKAGDLHGAANEFLRWTKAGKPPRSIAGLERRRAAERRTFLGEAVDLNQA